MLLFFAKLYDNTLILLIIRRVKVMNNNTQAIKIHNLELTGDEVAKRLSLLNGDDKVVEIQTKKVKVGAPTTSEDDDLTLATKGYVNAAAAGTHTHDASSIKASSENEGQFLRVVNGVATWSTVPSAEGSKF